MNLKTWIAKKVLGIDAEDKQEQLDAAIRADRDKQRIIDLQIQQIDELTADNQTLRNEMDSQMASSSALYNEMVQYKAENDLLKKVIDPNDAPSDMGVYFDRNSDTCLVTKVNPSWIQKNEEELA